MNYGSLFHVPANYCLEQKAIQTDSRCCLEQCDEQYHFIGISGSQLCHSNVDHGFKCLQIF